jgi:hypothetical protein
MLEEEEDSAAMLRGSTGRGFGCSTQEIRRAEFLFARTKGINHLWDNDEMSAGKD